MQRFRRSKKLSAFHGEAQGKIWRRRRKKKTLRLDHTKYYSKTWWPESEAIPPVIFVIILRSGVTVEVICRGIGVRQSPASGLWFQAVVKVEVETDERRRVQELERTIKQTTYLSFTFITG